MNTTKCLVTSLTFFACAIAIVAQQQAPSTSAASLTPTSSKEYVSAEGRFKVLFPASPNEIHEMVDSSMGRLPFHMFICPTSTISYHVLYMDYPINIESAGLVKKALDSAREGSLTRIPKKEEPQIVKEFDISVDGHAGRFLQTELKSDAMIRMRYTVVGNRLYVVGVGTPKTKPTVVDATNDYETIATRFMDSFKIIAALEADTSATWKEFSSTDGRFKVQFPGTPQQSSLPMQSSGAMHIAQYQSAALYSAMYFDYKETPKDTVAMIELLDNLRLGELDMLVKQGTKFTVLSECTSSLDGYPGRILVLELSDNRIYRRKMLVVKNRVYVVTASAPRDDTKTGSSYETLSLRFIDSFSFLAQQDKN